MATLKKESTFNWTWLSVRGLVHYCRGGKHGSRRWTGAREESEEHRQQRGTERRGGGDTELYVNIRNPKPMSVTEPPPRPHLLSLSSSATL